MQNLPAEEAAAITDAVSRGWTMVALLHALQQEGHGAGIHTSGLARHFNRAECRCSAQPDR